MRTFRTITCLLFPILLGLFLCGLFADNKALWISGIVLLVVDVISGITTQYFIDRNTLYLSYRKSEDEEDDDGDEFVFSYMSRLNGILGKEESAEISPCEIVYGIVNLLDAQQNLSKEEYYNVERLFKRFCNMRTIFVLI